MGGGLLVGVVFGGGLWVNWEVRTCGAIWPKPGIDILAIAL
jgi:hypothetical protein